jgi:hypothetical protein
MRLKPGVRVVLDLDVLPEFAEIFLSARKERILSVVS